MQRFAGPVLRSQRVRTLRLIRLLSSRAEFQAQVEKNPVLYRLWNSPHTVTETDTLNATHTLPITLRTKEAVFYDIKKENEELKPFQLSVKQYIAYAKSVIHFYRVGVQNVWKNRKLAQDIRKKYHVEIVESRGRVVQRQIRNGKDMVNSLVALESFERVEQEALETLDPTLVLNITRSEYQTVLRTERDFFKLPAFAVILVVFGEMTPLLCYMIPEIAPSTCVFPGLVTKMHRGATKAREKLTKLRLERYGGYYNRGEFPFQSVEKLPDDELKLLAKSLNLVSRYIPVGVYPSSILQSRLVDRFNRIKVDNHFLISNDQNVWNLNKNELIRCCVDRALVDFSKDDLNHIGVHELRMRLFFFLGLFEGEKTIGNVGLFALNLLGKQESVHFHNIQRKEAQDLNQWWSETHKLTNNINIGEHKVD